MINNYENFMSLVKDISLCFDLNLMVENDEGRLIAKSALGKFRVEVIDRYDDLSDELSDDNYVLDVYHDCNNIHQFIEIIKTKLNEGGVFWIKGVCISLNEMDLNKNTFDFYP